MPNFIEIIPVVWISIADTHDTHIDFYILEIHPYLENNRSFVNTTKTAHIFQLSKADKNFAKNHNQITKISGEHFKNKNV